MVCIMTPDACVYCPRFSLWHWIRWCCGYICCSKRTLCIGTPGHSRCACVSAVLSLSHRGSGCYIGGNEGEGCVALLRALREHSALTHIDVSGTLKGPPTWWQSRLDLRRLELDGCRALLFSLLPLCALDYVDLGSPGTALVAA